MISLYVVREWSRLMSRMGLMLTIPLTPFWLQLALARFPIFPFHTDGHEGKGESRGRIQITLPMPASSLSQSPLPVPPRLGSTFRASEQGMTRARPAGATATR